MSEIVTVTKGWDVKVSIAALVQTEAGKESLRAIERIRLSQKKRCAVRCSPYDAGCMCRFK